MNVYVGELHHSDFTELVCISSSFEKAEERVKNQMKLGSYALPTITETLIDGDLLPNGEYYLKTEEYSRFKKASFKGKVYWSKQ